MRGGRMDVVGVRMRAPEHAERTDVHAGWEPGDPAVLGPAPRGGPNMFLC